MLKKLKAGYRKFAHDRPGSRFLHLHRQWGREAKRPLMRAIIIIIAVVLIVAGFLLGLIPGVPGIFLGVLGLALIAAQFEWMARWCDRVEIWVRGIFKKGQHRDVHARPRHVP